ncbi:GIY-YIG nuclease family protein [Frigoribacterium sp. CFBP 8754]|uniref:GIY-YIG nuclease family protein n=1 Tax=Frigoribacterium sp. CFBP 8754 TaxID=2775290 RepID=UPI00177C43F0|nr:GIY-YIG nuclease family protein [Frigoribacterium sp. CFBP 8754]MBD8661462.1 GIY-YIG nuclease family protein [Frigoribacterium sp. CFBP 8754]
MDLTDAPLCTGGGDCPHAVEPGAPVPLCRRHLELAADWWGDAERGGAGIGVEDALPTPCPACGARLGVRWPSAWLCAVCEWRQGDVPDGELAPPRVDVVYYLRFRDRIKIGTTGNPRQRLAAIWHDELLALERGDRAVERARHEQFAAQRHGRTEWFTADGELLAHVRALAEGQPDPWSLHARWRSEAVARRV